MTRPASFGGWSNIQTDSGFVPIEEYRSLKAQYEIHRENINLVKECVCLEAKNSVLKYVIAYKTTRTTNPSH